MLRIPTHGGAARSGRPVAPLACLAFVLLLGLVVWAAALWIGRLIAAMVIAS